MQRRHQANNIPTEIVRTLVVIAETGSFTKAGEKLGLSQPAISAQVKRLQSFVGGPVFEKAPGGVGLTPRGSLALAHARKLLDANDHILSLGGAARNDVPAVRLGLAVFYVDQFLSLWKKEQQNVQVNFQCGNSVSLAKGLTDGYLDVACLLHPAPVSGVNVVGNWQEEFVWARSRDFVLSPGSPIPVVGWLGKHSDLPSIKTLEKAGLIYRIAFASSDHHSRISAVAAGLGIMALPLRYVTDPLIIAREYYLPPLEARQASVYVRAGVANEAVEPIIATLRKLGQSDAASRHDSSHRRDNAA